MLWGGETQEGGLQRAVIALKGIAAFPTEDAMPFALGFLGFVFCGAAAMLITFAVGMEVSLPSGGYEVANLSLMHFQALAMNAGIGAMIVGTMLICSAAIIGTRGR